MTVTIIGTGFVGVVSAAVYASLGNTVIGLDVDQSKVESLTKGSIPFYEPGLQELVVAQQKAGNLSFTTEYQQAISNADVIIIAVGTPSATDGQADLTYVFAATESLAPHLKSGAVVAIKSTVPPGTLERVEHILAKHNATGVSTASLPEFLREGSAVEDSLHPNRVVIGADDEHTKKTLTTLHTPLGAPIILVSPESAQMAKYSANAYLATRITFINQVADLCEKNGADIAEVIEVIGHDKRIGNHYWYPGFGYGGSCFPKDVRELAAYSRSVNESSNLFNKISELNEARVSKLLTAYESEVGGWSGKTIAVLGLSFKPNTNDMRDAPSTKVIPELLAAGASINAFDPEATEVADHFITPHDQLTYHDSISDAVEKTDVIIALIEWSEIVNFDFTKTKEKKQQWFIDARNQFEKDRLQTAGYDYLGVGR